eukprot:2082839-Prymnesium_polylepis.1
MSWMAGASSAASWACRGSAWSSGPRTSSAAAAAPSAPDARLLRDVRTASRRWSVRQRPSRVAWG